MLKQRIITALILAPVLLAIVIFGNHDLFAVLVVVIQSAAVFEWLKLNRLKAGLALFNAITISLFTLFLADKLFAFNQTFEIGAVHLSQMVMMVTYGVIWALVMMWLNKHRWGYQNNSTQLLVKSLLGVVAIMLFAFSLYQLYVLPSGHWLTLSLFFLIWVADIGAYVSGKTLGKHKLALSISPGKTWEGVIGAQVLVAIYAIIVSSYIGLEWYTALMIMIPVALFSVVGDLAASLGKRQAEVKDSSNLLPGHGGFIDRFDSLIAAAPLYYFLLICV